MRLINLTPVVAAFALACLSTSAVAAPVNAGGRAAAETLPFKPVAVAEFDTPWAIGMLPDGRMLITEKPGRIFLVTAEGKKSRVGNVPEVAASGQNGLLDIAPAPDFAMSHRIYVSYVAPGKDGSVLLLDSATLTEKDGSVALEDRKTIFTQTPAGGRGQPGGIITFDPEGKHLYFTVGDRMEPDTAQEPEAARGKILRLTLDGEIPPDNPDASAGGVRGKTWTTGHRNPYGLAFAPDGRLWEHEMGPKGGDEFNRIEPGRNYGWPVVSNGDNYDGSPIPRHETRPEFAEPPLYWNPVIAPAGLIFYTGSAFPEWRGSALIGGLGSLALVRVTINEKGQPDEAERFDMGARIRDVAEDPDGKVWVIEDDNPGRLLRLDPVN